MKESNRPLLSLLAALSMEPEYDWLSLPMNLSGHMGDVVFQLSPVPWGDVESYLLPVLSKGLKLQRMEAAQPLASSVTPWPAM